MRTTTKEQAREAFNSLPPLSYISVIYGKATEKLFVHSRWISLYNVPRMLYNWNVMNEVDYTSVCPSSIRTNQGKRGSYDLD